MAARQPAPLPLPQAPFHIQEVTSLGKGIITGGFTPLLTLRNVSPGHVRALTRTLISSLSHRGGLGLMSPGPLGPAQTEAE